MLIIPMLNYNYKILFYALSAVKYVYTIPIHVIDYMVYEYDKSRNHVTL